VIVYSRNGKRILSYSKDDPVGESYVCTTNDISSGTGGAESNQVLIRNTSDKLVRIQKLLTSTCVSSNNNIFRFYRNPTYSAAGTPLTITNADFRADAPASEIAVSTAPTVSDKGTRFMTYCQGATSMTELKLPVRLNPGESLLVTVRPNANGVTYALTLFWMEELLT
jgi:hypothetical protein